MRHYELMVILDPELEERTVAPSPRQVPERRPQRRWHGREDRDLGPSPARLRDQQEGRGHLRRRRPRGRARRGRGAGPPAEPQRVRAAHQGAAARSNAPAEAPAEVAMAGETVITVVGNLTADPELRFTPSGAAVANFTVASTPRTFDRQSQRVEGRRGAVPALQRLAAGGRERRRVADPRLAGHRHGRLKQRSYETKEGEKRTVIELEVDEIGPSLRYATAKVTKRQPRWGRRRLRWRRRRRRRPSAASAAPAAAAPPAPSRATPRGSAPPTSPRSDDEPPF